MWKEDIWLSSSGNDDISLTNQGNNDEAADDWDAAAVPEFGEVFVPVIGIVALFVVFRKRKKLIDS